MPLFFSSGLRGFRQMTKKNYIERQLTQIPNWFLKTILERLLKCLWLNQKASHQKIIKALKDLGTFCNTKHNVHRFTLNLHRLKIMIVESVPSNISCWGAVVFEKLVKQCHENTFFLHAKIIFVSWSLRRKLFNSLFNSFLKN